MPSALSSWPSSTPRAPLSVAALAILMTAAVLAALWLKCRRVRCFWPYVLAPGRSDGRRCTSAVSIRSWHWSPSCHSCPHSSRDLGLSLASLNLLRATSAVTNPTTDVPVTPSAVTWQACPPVLVPQQPRHAQPTGTVTSAAHVVVRSRLTSESALADRCFHFSDRMNEGPEGVRA